AVRIIVIQRNAEQDQSVRTRVWSAIDAIPLTQRPMDIALWSAWKETDLPRGVGYEYFAIGRVPQYSRVYISEARAHVHQNSDSFIYVISGAGVCVLGKEEYAIGEGNLIVVPRGLRHALRGSFVASSGQWGGEIDNDYTPK
ncbi:MAG TPA: cupin domain-containing protein, partial [Patescibacteria group bacterium]